MGEKDEEMLNEEASLFISSLAGTLIKLKNYLISSNLKYTERILCQFLPHLVW